MSRLIASCPTTLGTGGLGQHLAKIRSDALADGLEPALVCLGGDGADIALSGKWEKDLFRFPPFRWRPDLRVWLRHEVFDRQVARRLEPAHTVTAFMGAARHTFRRARELGAKRLVLEMPNSHPANVRMLHARARELHPIEPSWMGRWFQRKVELEIAMADEIRTNSDYTTETVVRRGADPAKIRRRRLGCDPRFARIERRPHPEGLKVAVLVGSLTVFKGVPFIVDIFRSIRGENLRLQLVGGWTDRGMKVWLHEAKKKDPRISWTSGDPAPHLAVADIALHPSWEDGWGYAPAEALSAGLPVLVTDQTGMKELAGEGPLEILKVGDRAEWTARLSRWAASEGRL